MAKKEKEAHKRELRSCRKALRALCKVGGAHGRSGWGTSYGVPPVTLFAQERGYFCGSGGDVVQHLQDLELLCEVLDAQR